MNQAITKAYHATNIINKFCKRMTFHEVMQAMRKKRELKDEKKQYKNLSQTQKMTTTYMARSLSKIIILTVINNDDNVK